VDKFEELVSLGMVLPIPLAVERRRGKTAARDTGGGLLFG